MKSVGVRRSILTIPFLLPGVSSAKPPDVPPFQLLPESAEVMQIGWTVSRAAVFNVKLKGCPESSTVVVYSVRTHGSDRVQRIAVITGSEEGARVLSDTPVGAAGAGNPFLGEDSGVYELKGEEGRPILLITVWLRGGRFEVYAWRDSGFKCVFQRESGGTGAEIRKTSDGRSAYIVHNDWHWGAELPDVYLISNAGVTVGYAEFPDLYTPYMTPAGDFRPSPEPTHDQAMLSILGLAYQGRYSEAIDLADKLSGWIYPSRGYRGGLGGAAFYSQLKADTYILQGRMDQAERALIYSYRLLACSRTFDDYRISQGAIRSRDQVREKYLGTHPEAMEEWVREQWNSFTCPPATEEDQTLGWKAMGDRCWKYLRLSDAKRYYTLALPGLRDLAARTISKHLEHENHWRLHGALQRQPAISREQWLAEHPEELQEVSETEASLARVEKALREW